MTAPLLFGAAGFVLFVLFDWRKTRGAAAGGAPLFALGMLLLAGATAALLLPLGGAWSLPRVLGAVWAVFWLAMLVYVLFFALPAGEVYTGDAALSVCTTGAYALCRHPGGWCFLFAYLGLWLLAGTARMGAGALVFSGLNFAYIALQDSILFPRYITGYAAYRTQTPFLLPSRRSLAACFTNPRP